MVKAVALKLTRVIYVCYGQPDLFLNAYHITCYQHNPEADTTRSLVMDCATSAQTNATVENN